MPLQVAICDDEKHICSELETALRKMLLECNVSHEIDVFSSAEKLCRTIESQAQYDLVFLDIEFAKNEINGVEAGRIIRGGGEVISIVFISWEKEYSLQLHKLHPFDFLIKPLDYEEVRQLIHSFLNQHRITTEDFTYKTRMETRRVKIRDIVYVESSNLTVTLHLSGGRKESFYGILKDVFSDQLQNANFLHIHASYAVNYQYVSALTRSSVRLSTGVVLPVSKQKKDEVEATYFAIMERRGVM